MRAAASLLLIVGLPAQARRPDVPAAAAVPSIEAVVSAEGFTPTPSQSEIYAPGSVLVPNGRGGHDVVVKACVEEEPSISIMSQSSIATTLAGGVSARLGMARGSVHAGIEKRLSFVDPEQRTIPLARLRPTDACLTGVRTAGALQDLSEAIVLHDVLVAIIKNTVCTKADASGGMVAIGEAEAAAYSECVQESDGQVPLGYKAVPLSKVLALAGDAVPFTPSAPAGARARADFSGVDATLDVDARLKEKACAKQAEEQGKLARKERLQAASVDVQETATAAWTRIEGSLTRCLQLPLAERGDCIETAQHWLSAARAMTVELPAEVEAVETDCGMRQEPFAAERRSVKARELRKAEDLLSRLRQAGEGSAAGACANPSALSCQEIANIVAIGVPSNVVIDTIRGAGGCFSAKTLACMRQKGIPPVIIGAAQSMR